MCLCFPCLVRDVWLCVFEIGQHMDDEIDWMHLGYVRALERSEACIARAIIVKKNRYDIHSKTKHK